MARMLGRRQVPGCCPGTRAGMPPGPDCSGGGSMGTRAAKRAEQRQALTLTEEDDDPFEREAARGECRHGCNGDDIVNGYDSGVCDFLCHRDLKAREPA